MEAWQNAVNMLYSQYESNGIIFEEDIFNTAEKMNLPLLKLEKLCSELTVKGVYISNRSDINKSDNEDVYDYAQIDYERIYVLALDLSPTLEPLIAQVKEIVPPQRNELSGLLLQIHSGNAIARERAIAMYIRLVIRIAIGYVDKTDVPLEDLISEGTIGLMTAIDRYDESIHGYFSSYASLWIRQVIDRYVLYQKSLIHIPVHVYNTLMQIEKIIESYSFDINELDIQVISKRCNIPICELEMAVKLLSPVLSINDNGNEENNENDICCADKRFEDKYPNEFSVFQLEDNNDQKELRIHLLEAMKTISERERSILLLRYGLIDNTEFTLEQIGNHYGVT